MASIESSEKPFHTTHEASRLLNVTPRTVQLWCTSGVLESIRTPGGHRRIPRGSIDRLLAAQFHPGTPSAIASPSRTGFRILVAEDDASLLWLYRLRLAAWTLRPEVTAVPNGFEALVRMGALRPDLLIADLHMPEWDGFVMLRTIRSIPELDDMEIVVVTGLDAAEITARGGLPRDVRVFPKPISFDELENFAHSIAARRNPAQDRTGISHTDIAP